MLPMMRYRVKLLPGGLEATVVANDVVEAAENLRAMTPANEALVELLDEVDVPDAKWFPTGPTRVTFDDHPVCVHFVAFRDEAGREYTNAVRLFGPPDFFHRHWDQRAQRDIADWDVVVFARGTEKDEPSRFNFDDSNEADDPAAQERREMR